MLWWTKAGVPNFVTYLNWMPNFFSGMWKGVAPKTGTKNTCIQNTRTIQGWIVNMIEGTYIITWWTNKSSLW